MNCDTNQHDSIPLHGIVVCSRCISIHLGQREGINKFPCTCNCHNGVSS